MIKQEIVSMFEDADLLDDAQLKLEKYHAITDAIVKHLTLTSIIMMNWGIRLM